MMNKLLSFLKQMSNLFRYITDIMIMMLIVLCLIWTIAGFVGFYPPESDGIYSNNKLIFNSVPYNKLFVGIKTKVTILLIVLCIYWVVFILYFLEKSIEKFNIYLFTINKIFRPEYFIVLIFCSVFLLVIIDTNPSIEIILKNSRFILVGILFTLAVARIKSVNTTSDRNFKFTEIFKFSFYIPVSQREEVLGDFYEFKNWLLMNSETSLFNKKLELFEQKINILFYTYKIVITEWFARQLNRVR